MKVATLGRPIIKRHNISEETSKGGGGDSGKLALVPSDFWCF